MAMKKIAKTVLVCVCLLGANATVGLGDGGPAASPGPDAVSMSPEQIAVTLYNQALRKRDKAWKLEEDLEGLSGAKHKKTEAKIQGLFEQAAQKLQGAVEKNPAFFQAHGSLGYSLRRLGRFEEALAAYDRALELNPNYPEAIEYRGEAYLGLDRVEEAGRAHAVLENISPEHAAQLLDAIETWTTERRDDPRGVEAALVEDVTRWVAHKKNTASSTASSSGGWR